MKCKMCLYLRTCPWPKYGIQEGARGPTPTPQLRQLHTNITHQVARHLEISNSKPNGKCRPRQKAKLPEACIFIFLSVNTYVV